MNPSTLVTSVEAYLRDQRSQAHRVLHHFLAKGRQFLLRSDLIDGYRELCQQDDGDALQGNPLATAFQLSQEAAMDGHSICLAVRPRIGRWIYLRFHSDTVAVAQITVSEFLAFKENLVNQADGRDAWVLEVDLEPFSREFQKPREAGSIGRGVNFLNRRLSSRLFEDIAKGDEVLLDFLRVHSFRGQQLMLNDTIVDVAGLRGALRSAGDHLRHQDAGEPWAGVSQELNRLGFEPGWGSSASRIVKTMNLLLELLEAPSPDSLEEFLGLIPMIFSLAVISPHGWFGQSNVLGRPDTGGQVVYILDQVRALEEEMKQRLEKQGLDVEPQIVIVTRLIPEAEGTTCDQQLEPIVGSRNARILRVPFRNRLGEVIPRWTSRFEVWPYLERFAHEAETELLAELRGNPDLIIGNYSDGNLVASLMSRRLGVTQCNIAHALEKNKYLYSDLYWRDNEERYHFSCQFTADVISMNMADFIITSTYQEIAGTAESVGQYEAHTAFTMPGLYRVVHGIDPYDPKFNIVSPGVDPAVYFPAADSENRLDHLLPELEALAFGDKDAAGKSRGVLADQKKPLVFTMARMDRIKNITGLVKWYARCDALRSEANLLIAAGTIDPGRSADAEERGQIETMHHLMDRYDLNDQVRWVESQVDRERNGELYRYIADRRGIFVQPALFEAFGLTVIEAMSTGLPTFATCFGGPEEIIEDGVSGFHIDPNHGEESAEKIATFFARCREDPFHWDRISRGALDRVAARYTWKLYAERMMTLSRVYGFWKYVTHLERTETNRYLEMFYSLQFRPLAAALEA